MGSGFKNIPRKRDQLAKGAALGLALALLMTVSACIPDPLDVRGVHELEQKIVVSSQLIPGQAVAVLLTKSIGALDASDDSDPQALLDQILIADASVRIDGNGQSYPLTYLGEGVYGATDVDLVIGQQYTLYVNSPGVGSVQAKTTVKPFVSFADVDAIVTFSGRDTLAQITYTIDDAVGSNWYMVNAQHVKRESIEERILNPRVTTKMLNDLSFEGGSTTDDFKILFDEVKPGDTLAVMLSNIDKDYYDFMKLREDTRFGLAAAIGEPINYPTNVEGGLGFFNLYVPDVRIITLDE